MPKLLKSYPWLLSVVALTFFIGCQQTNKHQLGMQALDSGLTEDRPAIDLGKLPTVKGLDLEGIKPPPLPDNYQEIVKKYQVITGNEVRQIIDALPQGKVLVGIVGHDKKREMAIPACFAAWNNEEVMFVPALLLEESALILQSYYKERPDSDKVQIIAVEKLEDWLQLLPKAGYGIAAPKTSVQARQPYITDIEYKNRKNRRNSDPHDGGVNKFFDGRKYQDYEEYENMGIFKCFIPL